MKPNLLFFFIVMLFCFAANAQKPDSAQAMVHYKFSHVRDTNNRDKPYNENMVLLIGRNASVYKSYDRKMQLAQMKKDMAEQMKAGGPMQVTSRRKSTSFEFYQFPNEKKLIRKESILTTYLVDEEFPVIKWKISADTMLIGNLNCQKATTHFKGRDYTAWFSPDLPYRSGPWKLNGLPGLIVEAYDIKKDIVFKFDGIDKIGKAAADVKTELPGGVTKVIMIGADDDADDSVIKLPENGVRTTEKEMANLHEAMRKDPQGFMQGQMSAMGMNIKMNAPNSNFTSKIQVASAAPKVENNPLELPERK